MSSQHKAALSLYRALLRYRGNLVHTDKEFYWQRVRQEFEKNRHLTDPSKVDACIETGRTFLKNRPLE